VHLILRHWRGEYPLLTSICGMGVLAVAFILASLRLVVALAAHADVSLAVFARIQLAIYACCAAVVLWAMVGIWRSARTPPKTRWLVRGGLGLVALALIPLEIATARTSGELLQLAMHRDPLGSPAKVSVLGDKIRLEGGIAQGTAERFTRVLEAHPEVDVVELSSFGGRIAEAEYIAAQIRDRELDTMVVDQCLSACTDVMLAGRRRFAAMNADVGFHQPTMAGYNRLDDKLATEDTRDAYLAAGIDPKFVERAFATASSEMWFPSLEEMRAANFVTNVVLVDDQKPVDAAKTKPR